MIELIIEFDGMVQEHVRESLVFERISCFQIPHGVEGGFGIKQDGYLSPVESEFHMRQVRRHLPRTPRRDEFVIVGPYLYALCARGRTGGRTGQRLRDISQPRIYGSPLPGFQPHERLQPVGHAKHGDQHNQSGKNNCRERTLLLDFIHLNLNLLDCVIHLRGRLKKSRAAILRPRPIIRVMKLPWAEPIVSANV